MPILHFLTLTNGMGQEYWVLPERTIAAHTVSGYASRSDGRIQMLLYSHAPLDTESRSEQSFEVALSLSGVEGREVEVTQFRFDKDNNSYFRLGRSLREERIAANNNVTDETEQRVRAAVKKLESGEKQAILQGLRELAEIGPPAKSAAALLYPLVPLLQSMSDGEIQAELTKTAFRMASQQPQLALLQTAVRQA